MERQAREAAELETQRFWQRKAEEDMQQWKLEQQERHRQKRQEMQKTSDQLDEFCKQQQERITTEKHQEYEAVQALKEIEVARENEELQKQLSRNQQRNEDLQKREEINLKQQEMRRQEMQQLRQEEMDRLKQATEIDARREQARLQQQQNFEDRQNRILNSVNQAALSESEQRRLQMEKSQDKWAAEHRAKEDQDLRRREEMRINDIKRLNEGLSFQLQEKKENEIRQRLSEDQLAISINESASESKRLELQRLRRLEQEKEAYRRILNEQMIENRNKAKYVGMNEIERAMNKPLLRSLNLLHCKEQQEYFYGGGVASARTLEAVKSDASPYYQQLPETARSATGFMRLSPFAVAAHQSLSVCKEIGF